MDFKNWSGSRVAATFALTVPPARRAWPCKRENRDPSLLLFDFAVVPGLFLFLRSFILIL